MELKDYQIKVLEHLESYLAELKTQLVSKQEDYEILRNAGKNPPRPEQSDFCQRAWTTLKSSKPLHTTNYTARLDGMERSIPNICFKVPTGGGKTLLSAAAVQRINQDYFSRNNGFVLWVVPSDTIYRQTSRQLRDREHPYRQLLDRASGGKTLILEKNDAFTLQDVEDNLCVMLLMLQSSNRQNNEVLKVFRDSGRFESFFPPLDDYNSNNALLSHVTNLDTADLGEDGQNVITGISIRHSLGNVMRLLRPVVVVDEGHRATSKLAMDTINSFNPRFMLELSATPKEQSNVLINVGGVELKNEQMIKLPINVIPFADSNWKHTLNHAHKKIVELNDAAAKLQGEVGTYIRPIMLIKAEPKKQGDTYDHVEDIKQYLIDTLQVREEEVRIKLSGKDEIDDEDLLDKLSPVKYIITKDALKEGWDCSFAYVLAILTNTRGQTALTQFIGRVLRQPYAVETPYPALNQCYVFCDNAEVNEAVEGIKKGLEEEGMGDISDQIQTDANGQSGKEKVKLKRKEKYKESRIFLPSLSVVRNGKPQPFEYHADIMADIHWEGYFYEAVDKLTLADREERDYQSAIVDLEVEKSGQLKFNIGHKQTEKISGEVNITLMVSQLMDKVPNAWQAMRIVQEVLTAIRGKGYSESKIALNSIFIVEEIKKDCFRWMLEQSKALFKQKLDEGIIFLKLLASPHQALNWEMLKEIEVYKQINDAPCTLGKNIFQPQYQSNYNTLERKVALAINNKEAVEWWHRLAVKGTEYNLQGWKREKIYPDFLVKLEKSESGIARLYFIESKGEHLEGNKDTAYKQELFSVINASLQGKVKPKGEFKLVEAKEELAFHIVFEDDWENPLNQLLAA